MTAGTAVAPLPCSPVGGTGAEPEPLELLVRSSTLVAEGTIALELVRPDRGALPAWSAGAHLELQLPSGTVRQYSLCGDLDHGHAYRIAVLRDPRSRGGSSEIHDSGLVGKLLAVKGPRNHFPLVDAPRYLFLAGGIGITPILPMLQQASKWHRPWHLVYTARTRSRLTFADEIDRRGDGTYRLVPADERGRIDVDSIVGAAGPGTAVYCCGPASLLDAAVEAAGRHLHPGMLHVERFGAPAPAESAESPNQAFEVELARTGLTLAIPRDRSVLDVVLDVVPQQLYSCEEGYCGTCRTVVLEGEPDHRDSVLSPEERRNTMMICVSRSRCPRLVLDI